MSDKHITSSCDTCVFDRSVARRCLYCALNTRRIKNNWIVRPRLRRSGHDQSATAGADEIEQLRAENEDLKRRLKAWNTGGNSLTARKLEEENKALRESPAVIGKCEEILK